MWVIPQVLPHQVLVLDPHQVPEQVRLQAITVQDLQIWTLILALPPAMFHQTWKLILDQAHQIQVEDQTQAEDQIQAVDQMLELTQL